MRRKNIAATPFAVIASVALAGCGGGGGSSSDDNGGGGPNSPTSANQAPTARLTLDHASGNAPLTVTASATDSSDADGTIASTTINFGDGGAVFNGTGTTHTYGTAGTFTVTVTVTDNGGMTATTTKTVTVASVVSQPANQAPVAQLSVTPTSGPAPLSVSADASASSDPDGTIASTAIDFGDAMPPLRASPPRLISSARRERTRSPRP